MGICLNTMATTIKIRNKRTGEIKEIPVNEAQNFGLDPKVAVERFNSQQQAEEIVKTGQPVTEKTEKDKDREKVKTELNKNANDLLSVIKQVREGKLKGDAAKQALNFASSRYAKSYGFGEGGKALTEPELTILGGSMPVIEQKGQSVIDRLTGRMPPQTGNVKDDLDTLERKMKLVLLADKGNFEEANKILNEVGGGQKDDFFGGLAKNAGTDIKNILNNILNLPRAAMGGIAEEVKQGRPIDPMSLILRGTGNVAKGVSGEYNELLGRPLEGGDIAGRAMNRAYEKPVSTALDLLPFLKLKGGNPGVIDDTANVGKAEGGILKQTGANLKQGVRNIDAGPSVYGAQQEARIIKTLDNVGIKGSPSQQYKQLEPKIAQISTNIENYLTKNGTTISKADIKNGIKNNIKELLPESKIELPSVQREIDSVLSDVSKSKGKTLSDLEVFNIKKKYNKSYSRIQNKLKDNVALTDREQVIYAARKTVDDLISSKHPEVKKATLAQSDLYDAADSLYKSRQNKPSFNLFGNQIPLPETRGVQDFLGNILQGR